MVDLAVELIERKSGKFDPEEFENHYHTALKELVDQKMKGHKIIAPHEEAAPRGKVVDLMAALRKSIGEVPAKPGVKTGKPAANDSTMGRIPGSGRPSCLSLRSHG